jgi:tetratricopeptide (TPR) repeat protein
MYCGDGCSLHRSRGVDLTDAFDSLMQAGLQASEQDDTDAALGAWQSAAGANPASALPHFLMGAEYAQAKRLAEAEAAFATAVMLAPEFETARYQLGLLQYTSGRAAVAHVTWEPLFHLPEHHPVRNFVLGFAALARDDFDRALMHFAAGVAANRANPPMNADIGHVIAAIHRRQGRTVSPGQAEPPGEDAHVLLAGYRQSSIH